MKTCSVEVIADGLKEALYALPSRWRDGDGERANIVIELTFRQYLELHLASEVSDQDAHPVRCYRRLRYQNSRRHSG